MTAQPAPASSWRPAVEAGDLGIWDLRPEIETVHHSPQWKQRLGFPEPESPDSTHFWRCRVHPEDLAQMLDVMHKHASGERPDYETRFRLRSHGSGYRLLHSRGRIIERDARGGVRRMVGTMIDLTARPATPAGGLPAFQRRATAGHPQDLPLHQLLCADAGGLEQAALAQAKEQMLRQVEDLLQAAVLQLAELRAPVSSIDLVISEGDNRPHPA